jgi:hypothetical protein
LPRVEDFLSTGESVLLQDGDASFTDRRVLVVRGRSVTAIPYNLVSSSLYLRQVLLLPTVLGALVLIGGGFFYLGLPYVPTLSGVTGGESFLILAVAVGFILIGAGVALMRGYLVLWTASGESYAIRVRNDQTLREFLKASGRQSA